MAFLSEQQVQQQQEWSNEYHNLAFKDSLNKIEAEATEALDQLKDMEGQTEDGIKEVKAAAVELFHKLRQTFGKDICEKKPSELTAQEIPLVSKRLAFYNLQLRYFYQGLIGNIVKEQSDHPGRRSLEEALSAHSRKIHVLFEKLNPPQPALQLTQAPLHPAHVLVIDAPGAAPEQKYAPVAPSDSYRSNDYFYIWQPSRDYSFFDSFWYWQGFGDGFNRGRPDLFDAIVSHNYCQGYWEGRGARCLVNLTERAIPAMFRAGKWVGAETLKAAGQGIQGLAHLMPSGGELKDAGLAVANVAQQAVVTCGDVIGAVGTKLQACSQGCEQAVCNCVTPVKNACCGNDVCNCAHQVAQGCGTCKQTVCSCADVAKDGCFTCGSAICTCLHNLFSNCGTCGQDVCNCVSSAVSGCGECGKECCDCLGKVACALPHAAAACCDGCGSALSNCRCDCDGDMCKAITGCCAATFTAIGSGVSWAYSKISHNNNHNNSTSTATVAGAPYTVEDALAATASAGAASAQPSAAWTAFAWTGMSVYAAAIVPNFAYKLYGSASNWYHGKRVPENATKVVGSTVAGGASYGVGYVLPAIGGPHFAFTGALFLGWATWKLVDWKFGKKYLRDLGHEDPDFLLDSKAMIALEAELTKLGKEFDPFKIQNNIVKFLEEEIKKERVASYTQQQANAGYARKFANWCVTKVWEMPGKQNARLLSLEAARKALHESNFAGFQQACAQAGFGSLPEMLERVAPGVTTNVEPSAPRRSSLSLSRTAV